MTTEELTQGNALKSKIDLITKIEAAIDAEGSKVFMLIADTNDKQAISNAELKDAIGTVDFDTLADGVLLDLSTALDTAKSAAEAALLAL